MLVYVPLTVDRKVMASVMNTHRFEGIRYEFVRGREVVLYLAPHESRRLFGGAEGPVHSHTHESHLRRRWRETGACVWAPAGARPMRIPDADARSRSSPVNTRFRKRPWGMTVPRDATPARRFSHALLQFGDSMFPIGGFSFSCGLESAIQKGVVADAATSPCDSRAPRWSRQRAATVSR